MLSINGNGFDFEQTRDLKMMPKSVRGLLKVRRTCRKKIHERITAVSGKIEDLFTLY